MKWVLVFTATVIADFIWARWSAECAAKRASSAAVYGGLIIVCSGFVTVEYVNDHWLLIPAVLGAGVGTYIAVKRA